MENKNKDNIKNAIIIVLALVIVFGGSFVASKLGGKDSAYSNDNTTEGSPSGDASKAEQESAAVKEDEQKDFVSLDIDKYLDTKASAEASVIYIGRPGCHYCVIQAPILKNIAYKYDIDVNYLNTDDLNEEDSVKFTNSDDSFKEGFGTPLMIVVKDDEIIGRAEGLTDTDTLVNFFKTHGIISE